MMKPRPFVQLIPTVSQIESQFFITCTNSLSALFRVRSTVNSLQRRVKSDFIRGGFNITSPLTIDSCTFSTVDPIFKSRIDLVKWGARTSDIGIPDLSPATVLKFLKNFYRNNERTSVARCVIDYVWLLSLSNSAQIQNS